MDIREDRFCFVCGPDNSRGLQADFVTREDGRAACSLIIPAGFQGWQELVHGGVIAALLDEAAVYACRSPGEHLVTGEINLRYRKPVPVGRQVSVTGELLERKRRVVRARSRLEIEGVVHAEAEVRLVVV